MTAHGRVWTSRVEEAEEGDWEDGDSMDSGKEPVDVDTVRGVTRRDGWWR